MTPYHEHILHYTYYDYFVSNLLFQEPREFFTPAPCCVLIAASFPFGGPIIIYILFLMPIKKRGNVLNYSDIIDKQENKKINFPETLNIEHETEIAPIEDVLLLADNNKRRQSVLEILKKDVVQYSNYLNLAIHNDDSETAHYAAAGILQAKRRLNTSIQTYSELYSKNTDNPVIATAYADLIQQYLGLSGLDPLAEITMRQNSIPVLENIVNRKLSTDYKYLVFLIDNLLSCGMVYQAAAYSQRLLDESPDTEEKFIVLLKNFYIIRDKEKFIMVFDHMLKSDVVFSEKTLKMVRFWMKAITYEDHK